MNNFKKFLFVEQKQMLNDRISPILNSVDSLQEDSPNMGSRQIIKTITNIANEIRKILNDDWPESDMETLKTLQKLAVFILKSIDSSDDLKSVIDTMSQEMHNMAAKNNVLANPM